MSLVPYIKDVKVSSVLNGDKLMYGKKYLFDGSDETCWNSDKGSFQHIEVTFTEEKTVKTLRVQFQGGFAAKQMELKDENGETLGEFHPRDVNQFQEFVLERPTKCLGFKLNLNASYDFYGRIIIYHLNVMGE